MGRRENITWLKKVAVEVASKSQEEKTKIPFRFLSDAAVSKLYVTPQTAVDYIEAIQASKVFEQDHYHFIVYKNKDYGLEAAT